jgi:hypothetical protein
VEIVSWLDDHSRYALSVTAHPVTTGQVTLAAFRAACAKYGIPASTLTGNGNVYTTRLAGGKGGRNALEHAPTPEPTSSCWFRTWTYASSTPPPEQRPCGSRHGSCRELCRASCGHQVGAGRDQIGGAVPMALLPEPALAGQTYRRAR